jgi:hypothetical protein
MTTDQLKQWARYYGKLSAVAAVNALAHVGYVATGAGIATATGIVDAHDFSTKGIIWSIVGTVAAGIFGAIYRNPIPEPSAPTVQI